MLAGININISLTQVLAVWGAFVGTLVLVWDIIKWKTSGPKIVLSVTPCRRFINVPRIPEDRVLVVIDVANNGDKATTIQSVGVSAYKDWFHKVRRKTVFLADVVDPGLKPLPYVLLPGTTWKGGIGQDALMRKVPKRGIVVVEVSFSHRAKRHKRRIKFPGVESE